MIDYILTFGGGEVWYWTPWWQWTLFSYAWYVLGRLVGIRIAKKLLRQN